MAQFPKSPPEPENHPLKDQLPVFDQGSDDLPWPQDDTLNADEEGNVLPGNDPLDEDPNDNGPDEQFDPEDIRRRKGLERPLLE
ncbi:hypothetical protein EEB11_17730 [Pseudotabrizicola sediminis]|uniref:Uncharacterized protein n=1 Tax=Pseudotabrizicola sediminis TaxID=2486418 RepID=A0ABY2KHC8_9RHOB|nr:hypothetical protein [Pseudotabrizicola sediminis]TGD41670.1 hypothetical protein EEB11_17730 [Pseudotabrizicola sediminis]TGD60371.1 hypothetical protein EYC08_21000 [Tabrizicola sp. WMC-M-20]